MERRLSRNFFADDLDRQLDAGAIDIQMSAGTHPVLPNRGDLDTAQPDAVGQFVGGQAGATRIEEDQVGFGFLNAQSGNLRKAATESPRVRVVLGETVDIMFESVGTGGSTNSRLP